VRCPVVAYNQELYVEETHGDAYPLAFLVDNGTIHETYLNKNTGRLTMVERRGLIRLVINSFLCERCLRVHWDSLGQQVTLNNSGGATK